jgi:hypothetical protein
MCSGRGVFVRHADRRKDTPLHPSQEGNRTHPHAPIAYKPPVQAWTFERAVEIVFLLR